MKRTLDMPAAPSLEAFSNRLPEVLATPELAMPPRLATENFVGRRIHFMGAGGIGVSAVMELARARGAVVSGCDGCAGGQIAHLRWKGLDVRVGHHPRHVDEADELVYSPAIREDHPEILRARARGIVVQPRMHFLGRLAKGTRTVGVTGSHGKTTLTWMIAHLLQHAGHDPSACVGGVVKSLAGNVRVREDARDPTGGAFVVEVDESDNRLSAVVPALALVTNIDHDHLEHYGDIEALEAALTDWLASAHGSGDPAAALFGCGEDERVLRALRVASARTGLPRFDYGFDERNHIQITEWRGEGLNVCFDISGPFGYWKNLVLPMPGRHSVLNAAGAITVAWRLGLDERDIRYGLACCQRVGRRFEIKGTRRGVRVIDDYGHHPAEIKATLAAARASTSGRVGMLFQPHRYSRTAQLMDQFATCFDGADAVFILPVYAASEDPLPGADYRSLAGRVRATRHPWVGTVPTRAEAVEHLTAWAQDGDSILIQGAGDVTLAADELLEAL